MSSAVYFKFKASIKQYTIPFDGSAISVKDLRNAIRLSCGLKSTDFELQILDKQGKEFAKEDDLIPKFSDLIVRRLPKANDLPRRKIANPEDMTRRDPYKAINLLPKINPYSSVINLAKSNIPDDEKIDIITKRCSEEYSEKNFLVKHKPYGTPPASYVCNKCHQGGHWIHECPGLRDKDGRLLDFKSVKRPTGIPQDFLLEVSPGTPGAYLTKEGKYMVPIKDAEAYAMGKKEKRPFSVEENPPYIPKDQEFPSKIKCSLCSKLLENPTCTPCCSSVYCEKCITNYLYDPEVNGSQKCPNCQSIIEHHTSLIEHELLRQLIQCWKANLLTKEIVDSCVTTLNHSSNKKTELNEDSSKSPELKFESANNNNKPDCENLSSSVPKTEITEKVFVNNRRVLKPKTAAHQMRTDSPSNIKPSTPDKSLKSNLDSKMDIINNIDVIKTNENQLNDEVKNEKPTTVAITTSSSANSINNNVLSDADVNDLIFEKVQDYDAVSLTAGSSNNTVNDNRSEKSRENKNINNKINNDQNNLKIEIVAKRIESNNNIGAKNSSGDRKIESGKMNNISGSRIDHLKGHMINNSSDLSSIQKTFNSNVHSALDAASPHHHHHSHNHSHPSNQQQQQQHHNHHGHHNQHHQHQQPLLNHFPATTTQLVTSVQQQFLNNPIPLNTLDPLQWPLMYNNIPLQTMFGAALNSTTNPSNWMGNGLTIPPNHGINQTRILTKEEFYERQRRLRAEKMKLRHRDSRSPSGSQSPRRKHKSQSSRSDYRSEKSDRKYSSSSNYQYKISSYKDSKMSSNRVDSHQDESNEIRDSRSSRSHRRTHYDSPKDRSVFPTDFPSQDIKKIDPKLMEDSIHTFLKCLTANPDDNRDSVLLPSDSKHSNDDYNNNVSSRYRHHHSSPEYRPSSTISNHNIKSSSKIPVIDCKSRKHRRSTRSRSVPKISKDRLENSHHQHHSRKQLISSSSTKMKKRRTSSPSKDNNSYSFGLSEPLEIKREVIARPISASRERDDPVDSQVISRKEKKSKKSKHRDHSEDEEDSKKKKKHKKHKHKKMKKVKKEKKID